MALLPGVGPIWEASLWVLLLLNKVCPQLSGHPSIYLTDYNNTAEDFYGGEADGTPPHKALLLGVGPIWVASYECFWHSISLSLPLTGHDWSPVTISHQSYWSPVIHLGGVFYW